MTDLRTRDDVALGPMTLPAGPRARRGAHRAAPPRVLALLPIALVVVAVALLGGAVWALGTLGDRSVQSASAPVTAPQGEDPAAAGGLDDGAERATPSPTPSTTPSASSSAPSSPSASASSSAPAAVADPDVPVVVLNATRTGGLAATTAGTLEDEGWEIGRTGNADGGPLARTEVRYPDADLEATAAAVADALGTDAELVLDDDATEGSVTVVAGADLVE